MEILLNIKSIYPSTFQKITDMKIHVTILCEDATCLIDFRV